MFSCGRPTRLSVTAPASFTTYVRSAPPPELLAGWLAGWLTLAPFKVRCFCEKQGTKLCMLAIQWINVGYDYQESRQLLAKTKWVRVLEVRSVDSFFISSHNALLSHGASPFPKPLQALGFVLGLVVAGREMHRITQQLVTLILSRINEAFFLDA